MSLLVFGDVGGDLPGADLIVRHFPRRPRDFRASLAPKLPAPSVAANHVLDASDAERPHAVAAVGTGPSPVVDQGVVQRIFERLAETERAFAERLGALESLIARQAGGVPADLSPLDHRLSAIEAALHGRAVEGIAAIDPALSDRLWAIEQALGTERTERAGAITALSDEISGVRSAVRLAAQNAEQTQASLSDQVQQLAFGLDQHRVDLAASVGDRIASIEQALEAHGQKANEAHAIYSAELTEVHEALMKISANQHTLAGAIDNWRNNDFGEIHLINTRIGAVHEDGAKRLAAIEKLCADVETLSHLVIDDKTRPRIRLQAVAVRHRGLGQGELAPAAHTASVAQVAAHRLAPAAQAPLQLEQLARIEDAVGIERRLDPAHQRDLQRALEAQQLVALQLADAVLGGDRAAEAGNDIVHRRGHRPPQRQIRRFVHAGRLRDVVVHVAVAEVTEDDRPRAGAHARDGRVGGGEELGDARHRHRNVVLDAAAFGTLRFRGRFAQPPQRLRLRQRSGDHRVGDDALLGRGGEQPLHRRLGEAARLGARHLDQDVPRRRLAQRDARVGDIAR